jgi:hypothetical protein
MFLCTVKRWAAETNVAHFHFPLSLLPSSLRFIVFLAIHSSPSQIFTEVPISGRRRMFLADVWRRLIKYLVRLWTHKCELIRSVTVPVCCI